jgi:8-oxo-dGTP pyrophosphatase MutT (NUDIX family)
VIIRIKKELVSKVIILDKHRILLLKRSSNIVTKQSPWTWDLPGGHIDDGEKAEDAATREVEEETKLNVSSLSLLGQDSNIGKLTYFYVAEDWEGSIGLSGEHEEYKWVSGTELGNYENDIGSMYYKMIRRALKT